VPSSLLTHTVPAGPLRQRADKALAAAFSEHSRAAIQRAFDAGRVRLAGTVISRDHTVHPGDFLELDFPEVKPAELRPVRIPLSVLFEDRHLLVVNKAAGMVVHPGAGTDETTLVHALLAHCRGTLSGVGGVERPGIVHRLDRETSGAMVVAKTDAAHRGLSEQFAQRTLVKEYLALVHGVPSLLSGSIRKAIGRNLQHRHKMAVVDDGPGGRAAHTDWEVVEAFPPRAALLRCTLHSGRTHQIRVHLKSMGHVILGDDVYGWKADPSLGVQPARVLLHAEHLVFRHPVTGKTIEVRAPLPDDFEHVLAALRPVAARPRRRAEPRKRPAARPKLPAARRRSAGR
jgi:23S rRNA pseudouridine1911/1915/1917 synthase